MLVAVTVGKNMRLWYEKEMWVLRVSELGNVGWGRGPECGQVLGFLSGVEVKAIREAVAKDSEFT